MINQFLFIYGTLLEPENEFAVYLQSNSAVYSKGKFRGRLYDIGEYPGAVDDPDSSYEIHGTIVSMLDPEDVLKHIDPYEGFGEGQRRPYLFIRKLINAETPQGIVECWVYIYHREITGFNQITTGDFLTYRKP